MEINRIYRKQMIKLSYSDTGLSRTKSFSMMGDTVSFNVLKSTVQGTLNSRSVKSFSGILWDDRFGESPIHINSGHARLMMLKRKILTDGEILYLISNIRRRNRYRVLTTVRIAKASSCRMILTEKYIGQWENT